MSNGKDVGDIVVTDKPEANGQTEVDAKKISDGEPVDDQGDARGFGASSGVLRGLILTKTSEDDQFYSMKYENRGKALIFNHKVFDPKLNLGERHGTNADRDRLRQLFTQLDFDVKVYDDLVFKDLDRVVEEAADADHSKNSCFALCFLSHGEQGILYAKDREFKPDILWERFTAIACPSLAGKPKMFFIQACQGDKLDEGVQMAHRKEETDAPPPVYKIPAFADFLIAYSTVPGFYSWRNTTNGSWFIQALHHVLSSKDTSKEDLLSLIIEASRIVATQFESNCPGQRHMHGKKQVPFITMTLTRKILLPPLKLEGPLGEPASAVDDGESPKRKKAKGWRGVCSCV